MFRAHRHQHTTLHFLLNYIIHRLHSQLSTTCFLATSSLKNEWIRVLRSTQECPQDRVFIEKTRKRAGEWNAWVRKHWASLVFFFWNMSKQQMDRYAHTYYTCTNDTAVLQYSDASWANVEMPRYHFFMSDTATLTICLYRYHLFPYVKQLSCYNTFAWMRFA